MNLTVFIIDDDQAARDSLTFLLRAEGLMARAYASAPAFLAQLEPAQRGCIVTDVRMPEMDGIALVDRLREIGCRMPVIVITGHADVPLAVQAMKAGVAEFIEKPFSSESMLLAVRQCLEQVHSTEAVETLRAAVERRQSTLTDREAQVLEALVEGLSNKEIGLKLQISPRTVEIYRANVMSKMQAASLSELIKMTLNTSAA